MPSPVFSQDCLNAFNEMNTQESPNDYFVAKLEDNLELTLASKGRGGMHAVKQILESDFNAGTAVAVFRITAVDDRENTVSYRTKLIHCIWTGPKTPVMKRAKVGSYNADFKRPFQSNLYLQTDDVTDLDEGAIERSLRLSGGAHAPSRYDYTNSEAPSERAGKAPTPVSPVASPASAPSPAVAVAAAAAVAEPSPEPEVAAEPEPETAAEPEPEVVYPTAEEVIQGLLAAVEATDVDAALACFTEDSEVVHMDATEKATRSYKGLEDIKSFYTWWFERLGGVQERQTVFESSVSTCRVEWDAVDTGFAYGTATYFVRDGKAMLATVVTVDVPEEGVAEEEAAQQE